MVREDGPAAVAAFGEALDMVRTLAVTDPDFARANRDVYVFLFRLGEAHRIAGNNLAALDTYF